MLRVNTELGRYLAVGLVALVAVVAAACGRTAPPSLGPMAHYESAEHPFSLQYPAEWIEHPDLQKVRSWPGARAHKESGSLLSKAILCTVKA